jgi:hypothetical protein
LEQVEESVVAYIWHITLCSYWQVIYLWIIELTIARLLWAFDISAPIDPQTGQKVEVDTWAYEPGAAMTPKPFKAVFKVRGEERERIIRDTWAEKAQSL